MEKEKKQKRFWKEIIEKEDLEVARLQKAYKEKDKIFFENWFRGYLGQKDRKLEKENWL